jgi:Flp pilus assembly protein TadB
MLRYIVAILAVQLGTLALYYGALQTGLEDHRVLPVVAVLELLFCLLMAFWFSSMARQRHQAELDALREEHARERERIKVNAERQKARVISKSHKELLRETRRAHAAANLKVGAAFAGALAFGAAMLYSQFVTLGLLVLTSAGGGLAGYLVRGRQIGGATIKQQQITAHRKKLTVDTPADRP